MSCESCQFKDLSGNKKGNVGFIPIIGYVNVANLLQLFTNSFG